VPQHLEPNRALVIIPTYNEIENVPTLITDVLVADPSGFEYAIAQGYDVAMEMDADFSHDPKMIPKFLEEIEEADLVIGSRYVKGVNVVNWPMSRLLLSYFANVYSRLITGMPLHDGTGGFKCFRTDVLRRIDLSQIKSNGYSFQIELNFLVWSMGGVIREIPIIFVDRRSGVSKMSKNIIFEAATLVWKLRLAKVFGRLRRRYQVGAAA
jgi:dolichol-phosphate mannosyltransferase